MDFVLYDFPAANAGDTIRVDIDAAANVQLVDDQNFGAYRRGGQYEYWGGHYQRTPVFLKVPRYGNWHIVIDLAGRGGAIRSSAAIFSG